MAFPYTGNPIAVEFPSPPPGPNTFPILSMPQDGIDPVNAAVYAGGTRVSADFIAYIQSIAALARPVLPVNLSGGNYGYTAVTHTGAGTGTLKPSLGSHQSDGKFVLVQIVLGGAVGTATFKTSTDGGNTYGGTQTTAANVTDATTGINFAFAGTFVATDTYGFTSAFTPQLTLADVNGNIRAILADHNGYQSSPYVTRFFDDWDCAPGDYTMAGSPPYNFGGGVNGATVVQKTGNSKFQMNGTASVGKITASVESALGCRAAFLQGGAANGNKLYLQSVAPLMSTTTTMITTLQWAARIGSISSTNCNCYMGLFDNYGTMSASTNYAYFASLNGSNWTAGVTGSGGTTGIAPTPATMQRFRIEIHGSATPLGVQQSGEVVLFFINENLVQTVGGFNATSGVTPYIGFGLENTGAGGTTLLVSPVVATYAHYASLPRL